MSGLQCRRGVRCIAGKLLIYLGLRVLRVGDRGRQTIAEYLAGYCGFALTKKEGGGK